MASNVTGYATGDIFYKTSGLRSGGGGLSSSKEQWCFKLYRDVRPRLVLLTCWREYPYRLKALACLDFSAGQYNNP